MHYLAQIKHLITTVMFLGIGLAVSGCVPSYSPLDRAYCSGGDSFVIPGGYTRTIFSQTNF